MIRSLQILRAIAAFWVVAYHLMPAGSGDSWLHDASRVGYAGVNLFFLISGFIMCYTTDERSDPWRFMGRRLVRIAPLYWLLTLFHKGIHSLTDPLTYLSMLFIPSAAGDPPFYGYAAWFIGWTLNYEMFFYLLFFLSLFIKPTKYRYLFIFGLFALLHLVFIRLSGSGWGLQSLNPYYVLPGVRSAYLAMAVNPLMLLFGVGIVAAALYKRFRNCPVSYNLAVLVAALVGMICFFRYMHFDGHSFRTSFFCLMLFAAGLSTERFIARSPRLSNLLRPAIYLGTISYSIYLIHPFFVIPLLPVQISIWIKLPLILLLTISVSALSYTLIERRLSEKLKRLFKL